LTSSIDWELFHPAEDNLPEKNAILLFHGMTGSPYEMKKYGMFLYKLGYDVFCYSFPGHGDRLDEIQDVTSDDWCKFAQEKYNQLRPKYNKFYTSGLCMGATIAIYLAENNPDITGVMSLSTTLFLDGFCMPKTKFMMPLALKTIFRYFYTFPDDDTLGLKNVVTRKSLAKLMSKTTVGLDNYPLNCVKELLNLSKLVRKDLKKVECPILVIHSKFDNLTSTKGAHIVYNNVSSEIKKYIELNDSYHMILYDNEKTFVMDSVKEFLEKLSVVNMQKDEAVL